MIEGWKISRWVGLGLVCMVASIPLAMGWSEDSLRIAVRASARTSILLFVFVFSASSLVHLWPSPATRWLLRNRRYLGVSFAISHLLHLDALVAIGVWFPEPFLSELTVPTLLGGGLAYVFIIAMALTSSDWARDGLGSRAWRRLHRVGSYYVWLIFAQSYVPRAFTDYFYVPAAILVVAPLVLRAMAWSKHRSPASRRGAELT